MKNVRHKSLNQYVGGLIVNENACYVIER